MPPARPSIRIDLPARILPGDKVRVNVQVDCVQETRIAGADLELRGVDVWKPGGFGARREFLRAVARLCGPRTLPAGPTRFEVGVPLPDDAPPTHHGAAAETSYLVETRLALSRFRRVALEVDVVVRPRPQPVPPAVPARVAGLGLASRRDEPFCEISLASRVASPGQEIHGALSVHRVDRFRYVEVVAAARALEERLGWTRRHEASEVVRCQVRLDVRHAEEGQAFPFRIRLPQDVPVERPDDVRPDGSRALFLVRWELEIRARVEGRSDLVVSLPLRVVAGAEPVLPYAGTPAVGAARVREMWGQIGRWHELQVTEDGLVGTVQGLTVTIRRLPAPRGAKARVEATISYPPLDLGLAVRRWSSASRPGASAWEARFDVTARDRTQALAALEVLLGPAPPDPLVSVTDAETVLSVPDPDVDADALRAFIGAVIACAHGIGDNRHRIPGPRGPYR